MDNRAHLEELVKQFSPEKLTTFLRAASGKFHPGSADYGHYLNDAQFTDLRKAGQIGFADSRRLIVLDCQVESELTSHSGKQRQYEIAKKVLKEEHYDAGIFVFHDNAGHFRFSLITTQYLGIKREFSSFRRYTYFVAPEYPAHTFINQIGRADFSSIATITEAFSEDYYRNDPDKRRQANFHRKRLDTLFFMGLNNEYGRNLLQSDPQFKILRDQIGEVPFLNGGLFEREKDDEEQAERWLFSDTIVAKILSDLVYKFNFTVTESTPLDVEVAVDPEMLGRIFEELVTGRHESGSYYTPKPVVAFMCREALKGYLGTSVGRNSISSHTGRNSISSHTGRNGTSSNGESAEAIALFVDKNDASQLKNPEAALEALRAVRVCDPACGSGAYLLGMLHELLEQRECLFAARKLDAKTIYDRKLEIIQNNLYGVDKDDFAVNIARLRLWLSLVVDDIRNPLEDPNIDVALPNLDFKIESGDSLTAPDPSGGLQPDMFRQQQVQEFLRLKNEFLSIHAGAEKKKQISQQIKQLRVEIEKWAHPVPRNSISQVGRNEISSNAFDWQVDFAEVFAPELAQGTLRGKMAGLVNATKGQMELTEQPKEGGFDIVLANPPYVRADTQFKHILIEKQRQKEITEWQNYRSQLKDSKIYKTLHEKWDLYIPFLERAYQLLHRNGQMIFIIPDAYNAAKYAGKSHEFFLQNTVVERIDFCSEINLFDAGVNNTILHFAKITPTETSQPVRVRRWGEKDEFENNFQHLPQFSQQEIGDALFKPSGAIAKQNDGFELLENICYISVGMVIHADERKAHLAFKASDVISDVKDKTHPKKFVEGKDLIKWLPVNFHYLEYGTKRAPALFRRPTFPELYEVKEKLISMDLAGDEPKVVYDNQQLFHNHSGWSFVPWHFLKGIINSSIRKAAKYRHQDPLADREQREETSKKFHLKYVLAIMNSSFACEWLKGKRRSKMHIYPDDWKKLPVAPIPLEEQKEFVKLVDMILGEYEKHGYPLPETSAEKVREWEGQLEEMVARLYE